MQWLKLSTKFPSIFLLLAGGLAVLGFAPYYLYPITFLSLICLMYFSLQTRTTKEAAWYGFVYALGLFGVGIYWIYISLHDFGGMPPIMAFIATFLLCAFMASFTAGVMAAAFYLSKRSSSFYFILAIATFWALADWTRSWIFTGFPWLTIGYSQVPYSPLAGFVPMIGVYGVSFLTVLIAGLISYFLFAPSVSTLLKRNCIIFLVLVWVAGSLCKLIEWSQPSGEPIKVALIQGNISQDVKWSPDQAQKTIDLYLKLVQQSQATLTVLPETALPILSHQLHESIRQQFIDHAKTNHGNILIGMVEYQAELQAYFNSALSFGSEPTQIYQKSHLVPFGEFIPLKQIFGWIYRDWLNMPLSDLSRGEKFQTPMQLGTQKVAVNICYEDVFGEEIIRQLPEATLLANISNDAWYGKSFAAEQHLQFSQARALETGRMALRATNTGSTAMIDAHGMVLAHAPRDVETVLVVKAQGYTGTTPYVKFGNWPVLLLLFCLLIFLACKKMTVQNRQNK